MASSTKTSDGGTRTILWCVPRAISTALAKCLSFIDDSEIWFEPYTYARGAAIEYNYQTKLDLPMEYEGNEEIFQRAKQIVDPLNYPGTVVADRLSYGMIKRRLEESTGKHVIVKDIGMGLISEAYFRYMPKGYRHTFLIRNPVRVLYSYRKMMYKFAVQAGILEGKSDTAQTYDIERDDRYFPPGCFMKELYDIWKYVKDENIDAHPIVIDSDDLLTKPGETLSAYCAAVGLPYDDSLLKWDASIDALKKMKSAGDDLVVHAVNFYGTAMKSSCFLPPSKFPSRDQLSDDVIRCSDRVMKYYEEMYETRIKI